MQIVKVRYWHLYTLL